MYYPEFAVYGADEQHECGESDRGDQEFEPRVQHAFLRRQHHGAHGRSCVLVQKVGAERGVHTDHDGNELEDDAGENDVAAELLTLV